MENIIEKAKKIKALYEDEWIKEPSVVSIGVGLVAENSVGIIIGVHGAIKKTFRSNIPDKIEGIPLCIKNVDPLRAL
jgi:hypothetical protein